MDDKTSMLYPLLLRAFLALGKARVFPKIPSRQLREALQTIEIDAKTGVLYIPHYWAIFAHDGRGPSPADKDSAILVWFKNPEQDPRYPAGRYPVTKSDVKHLTPQQFKFWLDKNRKIIADYKKATGKRILTKSDYLSMDLPLIVARNSPGNRGRVEGVPFFSNTDSKGMVGFDKECNEEGYKIFNNYMENRLNANGILHKKITATLHI